MNSISNISTFLFSLLRKGFNADWIDERRLIMNNQLKTIFLFILYTSYSVLAVAQSFPVQVIPQATPPAPIYISNYADASTVNSPLRIQIILNDFEIVNREVRIKTYFEGSALSFQSNDFVVGASPLFLEGGVPLVLTNVELAPYFRFENITGINGNQYGNALPEGAYQFCVEVYDVLTGNRLSNRSCAVSVVFQNEPPFLVMPRNKTNVEEINPQYIVFQWTPRSINVSNVEYELSLVEIWDNQVDPQQAFLSSPPVFQTTTTATTYVYGPTDPLLLSGKNYAWRVQAKARQGIEEIGLFKNQGYSEIFSFSYAGSCDLPISINHEVKGSTNANIFWDDFSTDIPEYTVRYRQKNSSQGEENAWFLAKTTTNSLTLWDLKAGTTYEYQVQKACAVTKSEWNFTKEFTTFIADDVASVYECGITPDFALRNTDPLGTISVGDKFIAGDFPITLVTVSGSNGRFTGKGYVTIPYLNNIKVAVAFTNVLINTDKQLAEGSVITEYDPSLSNILDVNDAIDTVDDVVDSVGEFFEGDNDLDEIKVDWTISKDDISIEEGMVVITNPNNGVTTKEPLGDDMIITDQEGNTYYVDPDGKITEGGQISPGGEVNPSTVSGVSSDGELENLTAENIIVKFNTKGTYGFDQMPEKATDDLKKEYQTIKDFDGNDYVLSHHAVKNGGTTQLLATITIQNNAYTPDQIVFKNKQGKIFTPTSIDGNTATIILDGVYTFENETIYALVPSKEDADKQLTAGAFILWHLAEKTIDVAIVSVGASVSDVATIVNTIFENGLAKINFKNPISIDVNAARIALGTNGMDVGESPLTAAYNNEQEALKALAKSAGANDSNTYYLIVLGNEFGNTKAIAGFMPLQRQFGFVFQKYANSGEEAKGTIAKTVAHEIGHGIFALQHPFAQYDTPESSTDWLMDYSASTGLPHTHWSQMHDPTIRFYVFQDEEDGEIAGRTWFTPDWTPFSIGNSSIIRNAPESNKVKGTVPGFRLNNDIAYDARYDYNGKFLGYFTNGTDRPYELALIPNITDNSTVYIYLPIPGECPDIFAAKYGYVNSNKENLLIDDSNTNLTRFAIAQNCSTELCVVGQQYFDSYKDLPTVEGLEEDYLRKVAELICEEGSDELMQAQKATFEAWENSAKSIAQNVQKTFTWEKYYKALNRLNRWVSQDVKNLLTIDQRDELFELAFRLEIEALALLSLDKKLDMFKIMFNGELETLFSNHHEVIAKLTAAIKDEEASAFLAALESNEYKVNGKPLIFHFKNRLSKYFTGDAYTDFFREVLRLSTVMATEGNLKIETTLIWDVEQKDYVLVSYVQNRNDFTTIYDKDTFRVTVKKCISCCSGTRGCNGKRVYETLLNNVSPFHMIGLTILNDVSPLASGCAENPRASEICGAMTPVPAIFLEYLGDNESTQRWKNFGWNTFNVAITIATLGEGAGAITAIRAAQSGTRVTIALQNAFKLFDFAYTVTDITLGVTESGPYGCSNLATEEEKQECREKWEAWKYVSYALAAKGGLDLVKGLAKSTAKVSRFSVQELREFIRVSGFKKNNTNLDQAEIDEIFTQLEDIIQRNGLQDEYQAALRGLDELTDAGSKWLDDLESLLGAGSKIKIQGWIDEGLDISKVELSFANATEKTNLFNKLENAKSIQHQRVLTNDLDNIPGVISGQYVSNSVDNVSQNIVKTAANKQFILKPYQAETFQKNVNLINRTDIEVIEDLNNGIQLVKVRPGTKIYRVYDGYQQGVNTLPKGNYWTFEKPSSISEVIGGTAVQPEWNSMTKIIEVEVPSQGIYVWRGKAAKQPLSNNENISNYYLQGGTEQLIFDINQNTINITSITNRITDTPW